MSESDSLDTRPSIHDKPCVPCKHCGTQKRRTPKGAPYCPKCQTAKGARWQAANREKCCAFSRKNREKSPGYRREYYLKNKEKELSQSMAYQKRNPEKRKEWSAKTSRGEKAIAWRAANKEHIKRWNKDWHEKNREHVRQRMKEYLLEYTAKNKEKIRAHAAAYCKTPRGREIKRAATNRRRVRRLGGGSWLTEKQFTAFMAMGTECFYCRRPPSSTVKLTMDHVIPLIRGGEDAIWNVVHACQSCNCSKHDKFLWVWKPEIYPIGYHPAGGRVF